MNKAYHLQNIRTLFQEGFSENELRDFCFDEPDFKPLYAQLALSDSSSEIVHKLLEYAEKRLFLDSLLVWAKKQNPGKYQQCQPYTDYPEKVSRPSLAPERIFQPPRPITSFIGRQQELAKLGEILVQKDGPKLFCLAGMGGIGKTALAIHLAYLVRDDFPDGVLWGNVAKSQPLAILDSWARAYGCDFSSLPDLDSRTTAVRDLLEDKRVLIILDDVRGAEKICSLLPVETKNVILLTTRDLELATALNAYEIRVSVLEPAESFKLLAQIVGQERIQAEEQAAAEICRLLGHLPLAIEIAARRLASHERWKLAELVQRLRNVNHRLKELKVSDRQVRTSFAVSWEALPQNLRRIFAVLGVFEGRAICPEALAAVAEIDRRSAQESLDALVALSLISEEADTYYRQHPLLADFAGEQLGQDELAYARMAQYYLRYATTFQQTYSVLEQEWENIIAGMRTAYEQHRWQNVLTYAVVLENAYFARARFADARQGYQWAAEASEALGDYPALADSLCQHARACIEQCDYAEAEELLIRSLHLWEALNDQPGIANARYYLGRIAIEKADFDKAHLLFTASRHIREQLGDKLGVAEILYLQADIPYYNGDYETAKELGTQALRIQQNAGDKAGSIRSLNLLADIALKQNNPTLAEKYCQDALAVCEEIQEQGELAVTLYNLSEAYRLQGDLKLARSHAEKSLTLLTRMGDRKTQANALWRLSLIDADLKHYILAREEGLRSLNISREIGDSWGMVYSFLQLGDIEQALDQPGEAQISWSKGLELAQALPEHPLTEVLRRRLGQDNIRT